MTQQAGFEFYAGIDRGVSDHQCCVVDRDGKLVDQRSIKHSTEAILAYADWLLKLCDDPRKIAVAAEAPHGAIIETLVERGFVMFSINPKQLDRFRDRHSVAGAKDDRRDAFVLANSLRTDLVLFRRVELSHPMLLRLREISRADDELKSELNALSNRLREQLHRCMPALLGLSTAADEPWLWTLLSKASTPQALAALSLRTARTLLKQHRIRRLSAEDLTQALRQPALPVAEGVAEAVSAHIGLLLPRLQLVHRLRRQNEQELGALLEQLDRDDQCWHERTADDTQRSQSSDGADTGNASDLPAAAASSVTVERATDVQILMSMPGIGLRVATSILAEGSDAIIHRQVDAMRGHSGAAPVTKQSGKSKRVHIRHACNTRLRNAMHYMADGAIKKDEHWKACYSQLRARGHSHARALRTVADRLLTRLFAALESGTVYDKELANRTLKQRHAASAPAVA